MMGEWQELSGMPAPNPIVQEKFWSKVRSNIGQSLDLREGERLCAIAYVKRRFVHVWDTLYTDWELGANVPSVSYMAAVHWLEELIKADPDNKAVQDMCDAAKKAAALSERLTRIECISTALNNSRNLSKEIADIDGRLFFDNELRQLADASKDRGGEIKINDAKAIREARKKILDSILNRQPDFPKEPTPFYAILLMDGDNLGAAIADGKADEVSKSLESFTNQVSPIVKDKNGFLIYAGGDDVLALLPVEDAIECALKLRKIYLEAFKQQGFNVTSDPKEKGASISATIIYAHMKLPLTAVLKDSHRLLDDVAKKKTGRDAIAIRVWKPGGFQLTWAMKWDAAGGAAQKLENLADQFRKSEKDKSGHASKPLYRIRERLTMLKGGNRFNDDDIKKLLVAEYVTSGVLSKEERKKQIAEDRIDLLMPLCKKPGKTFGAEAAILVRFLAQKEVD
jgi:CRISPR-associated protein Cmr2